MDGGFVAPSKRKRPSRGTWAGPLNQQKDVLLSFVWGTHKIDNATLSSVMFLSRKCKTFVITEKPCHPQGRFAGHARFPSNVCQSPPRGAKLSGVGAPVRSTGATRGRRPRHERRRPRHARSACGATNTAERVPSWRNHRHPRQRASPTPKRPKYDGAPQKWPWGCRVAPTPHTALHAQGRRALPELRAG